MDSLNHLDYIPCVLKKDQEHLMEKEKTYKGSWKKRGGVGAFMMLARKWDRLENMMEERGYDVFKDSGKAFPDGVPLDGTPAAEIADLRRYLVLVEAELTRMADEDLRNPPKKRVEEDDGAASKGGRGL